MSLYTYSGTLTPAAPFNFEHSLRFLGKFRPMMGQQIIHESSLTKAFYADEHIALFTVTSTGTSDQPQMTYSIQSEHPLTDAAVRYAAEEITFLLSLNDDLNPFYALAEADARFWPVVQKLYGYHQVKFSLSAFENACWAVLSQRNPIPIALNMKTRLTEHYGSTISVDGVTHRAFPRPFEIAQRDPAELNEVIRNSRKTETLLGVARAFDTIDESWLRGAPYDHVQSWLLDIKGIGAWSSSFILLRGLGRMEQIPSGEKVLLDCARRVYGDPVTTDGDIQRLGSAYGDYAGYWAHYLRVGG